MTGKTRTLSSPNAHHAIAADECQQRPSLVLQSSRDKTNNETNEKTQSKAIKFFLFICLSTAFRSFEAGIISSTIPSIHTTLHLNYAQQGTIAASPDYGIAPGAVLAILSFRYLPARTILTAVMFGTCITAVFCSLRPSFLSLVTARAFGGLLWSHAATYYPVWIDRCGESGSRTIWLACTNVSLLSGILAGYVVGGAVTNLTVSVTWTELYFAEGVLMGVCGVVLWFCFEGDLMRIDDNDCEERDSERGVSLWQTLYLLMSSTVFDLAVAITGCLSGGVIFALYFITQVCVERGIDETVARLFVTAVFVTAPAPGMLFGSFVVEKLGGYTDHIVTFGVALASAVTTLLASILFYVSWHVWGERLVFPFLVTCWIFFFAGGMVGPPMNGVAVSAVPTASHVASGLQFALANSAKIFVPQIGGFVCNRMGLIDGFNATIIICAVIFVFLSLLGLMHANQRRAYQRLP